MNGFLVQHKLINIIIETTIFFQNSLKNIKRKQKPVSVHGRTYLLEQEKYRLHLSRFDQKVSTPISTNLLSTYYLHQTFSDLDRTYLQDKHDVDHKDDLGRYIQSCYCLHNVVTLWFRPQLGLTPTYSSDFDKRILRSYYSGGLYLLKIESARSFGQIYKPVQFK